MSGSLHRYVNIKTRLRYFSNVFVNFHTNFTTFEQIVPDDYYLHHRLNGSSSPVLTATCLSYGSLRLSDFFQEHAWGSDPSTDLHAKWLK